MALSLQLPADPDYGKGCLRRHIKIHSEAGRVVAALEDDFHAFTLRLAHDGREVTGFDAEWQRHPTTTCGGASDEIRKLVGCPLSGDVLAHRAYQPKQNHCTHFFDLAGIIIAHAWRQAGESRLPVTTEYQAIVTDKIDGECRASLSKDGLSVMEWQIRDYVIQSPDKFRAVPAIKGLIAWARQNLTLEELEYAVILQMAIFVSQARPMKLNSGAGRLSVDVGVPQGSCYAVQPERVAGSIKLASGKDYSFAPEQILRFFKTP